MWRWQCSSRGHCPLRPLPPELGGCHTLERFADMTFGYTLHRCLHGYLWRPELECSHAAGWLVDTYLGHVITLEFEGVTLPGSPPTSTFGHDFFQSLEVSCCPTCSHVWGGHCYTDGYGMPHRCTKTVHYILEGSTKVITCGRIVAEAHREPEVWDLRHDSSVCRCCKNAVG